MGAIYPFAIQVTDAAGLMAYDVDYPDLERRAAEYVDEILRGAKPFAACSSGSSRRALLPVWLAAKALQSMRA